MGVVQCLPQKLTKPDDEEVVEAPVWLHAYDLGTSCTGRLVNGVLRPLGSGAVHCGVEVYESEWSYCEGGVFVCKPRACGGHTFHESVPMGTTPHPRYVVAWIIEACKADWTAEGYHLLRHNCCHFCADLCRRLGAGAVPHWVVNLSNAGSLCHNECCMQERVVDMPAEVIGEQLEMATSCESEPVAKIWRVRQMDRRVPAGRNART